MFKIGLIAHRKGSPHFSSAYDVLYTWEQITAHNCDSQNVPIHRAQYELAKMLERNVTLEQAVIAFQDKAGCVTTKQDQLGVYTHRYFNQLKQGGLLYHNIQQQLIMCYAKYYMPFDCKEMSGEHRLYLFYANMLDTHPDTVGWSNAPITYTFGNGLHINIRYNNVKKNTVIAYVEKHWKELQPYIENLPDKGEYTVSGRDWQIYELREQGETYSAIAAELFKGKEDRDDIMDEAAVKTAYQRVCKRIASLFMLVAMTKKPRKNRKKKH